MADTIAQLPPAALPLAPTAKFEVQVGTGPGSSQHVDAADLPISDATQAALDQKAELPTGPTFEGHGINGGTLSQKVHCQSASTVKATAMAAATAIDAATGHFFSKTITANTTFSLAFTGAAADEATAIQLMLYNAGSYAVGFPVSVSWSGGIAPTFSVNKFDLVTLVTIDGGATWKAAMTMYGLS